MSNEVVLTGVQQMILDLLRGNEGEFFTRKDIAKGLGMKPSHFTNFYVESLNHLIELNLVAYEIRKRGIAQQYFVYRAI